MFGGIWRKEPRQLPSVRVSNRNTLHHCQAAQKTQVWVLENIAEHTRPDIRPPSSPTCSSLIYFVHDARGQLTNKSNCNNEGDLRVSVIMTLGVFYGT